MAGKNTVNHQRMREINSRALLNTIRLNGPKSRKELAGILNLDGTTVTNLVRDLLRRGFLKTPGEYSYGSRGKPGELLSINPDGAQIAGFSLQENMTVSGLLANLNGEIIYQEHFELRPDTPGEKIIGQVEQSIAEILHRTAPEKLLGISVSLPGIWQNGDEIHTRSAAIPQIREFNMRGLNFHSTPKDKIHFSGNLFSLAEAEIWFGKSGNCKNFLLVHLDYGIGAACVANGSLVTGSKGLFGEIGHFYVGPDASCVCGKKGCLEAFASIPAINGRFAEEHSQASGNYDGSFDAFTQVVEAFNSGDAKTVSQVSEIADKIAQATGNAMNLVFPEKLILHGELLKLGPRFIEALTEKLKKYVLEEIYANFEIVSSELTHNSTLAHGSTVYFLKKFFLENF